MFVKRYSNVSEGPKQWQEIKTEKTSIYNWDSGSTYVKKPPFFENLPDKPEGFKPIKDARPLLILRGHGNNRPYFTSWEYSERKSHRRIFYGTSNFTKRL